MITVALLVFGLISYNRLGIEENPDVDFPFLTIFTVYPGADPATVESEVTERIEDVIATVSGIKTLTSSSEENVSFIFIEFELGVDINIAAQDVRDKMEGIQRRLPDDAEMPVVQKFDMDAEPVLDVTIAGDIRPQDLADYVNNIVKPRIESVEGVGSVSISGLREREIRIWIDPDKLTAYEMSIQDVVRAIQSGNVEIPGGRVETGDREFLVITSGELQSVDEFADLIVGIRRGHFIKLSDVARVEDGLEEQRSLARLNLESAISISAIKKSGANTIETVDQIYEIVAEIRAEAPPGIQITIPRDNSIFIRDSFKQVQEHLYGGGLMAILIVLLFLGSFRTMIIAAVAIPTSIITTYIFMEIFGFTLNNVTMLAFTLMVGMLIDDAIVMLENIYRHADMGKPPMQAARDGAKEIGFALMTTTLTILAVFVPVAFMSGLIGRFMFQYGITVATGSIMSFFVAVTLAPMLASRFMKGGRDDFFLFNWFNKGFAKVENGYRWLIGAALRRKGITVAIAIAAMVVAVFLFKMTPQEFITKPDFSSTGINIEMPLGTSVQTLSEFVKPLEEKILEIPEVENILTTLGTDEQNEGTIYVDLVDKLERDRTVWEIEDDIRERLAGIPGAKIILGTALGPGGTFDFTFDITGDNLDETKEVANELVEAMLADPMFREVETNLREGKPEVRINIDRKRAADLGINVATIGSTLRLLVSGEDPITTFKDNGEQYDVKVRLESPYRDRPEDLESLVVYNRNDEPIEVAAFASVEISSGTSQITHLNKQTSITINANLNDGYRTGDASEWAQEAFETLPPSIKGTLGGMAEIMGESFREMGITLILAIILIYVVLASQFNHFIHPLTIMVSMPLSFAGAFGLLYVSGMAVSMFALIGVIMLMGIVTKNAILVVEFANQLRERGMERDEAMLTAGPIRLRPVVMTALSTIGGMLPVALMLGGGAGVELRAPMAVAVIGGLAASTLLTLVVVPVVYSLFDQMTEWLLKVFKIKKVDEGEPETSE